ncbi:MAG: AAA family ATPase [Bacteroidetes bacterium]|nr:AAA family ATPase [Bacteroidota bacterium]
MKRDIIQPLIDWKNRKNRNPLILRGARQVGKTHIIEEFASAHFNNCIKVNLEEKPELKRLFYDNDVKRILSELSIVFNEDVSPGDTLLFIDEIQTCPEAILSLRYFKEMLPELHVISAGSLLDHVLCEIKSPMPVGRVEFLYMYPMNFKEFLRAMSQDRLISYIESYDFTESFSELIHKKISQYLRYYFFIGGMPAVVKAYTENEKLTEIERVHNNIITSLQYDFSKCGTRKQQEMLVKVMKYCGRHPGRKIKYSNIDRDTRSAFLKESINKLELSRIIHSVKHTNSGAVPLTGQVKEDIYKTIFMDIGFVNHFNNIDLIKLDSLITAGEGMLAEQFVGQELLTVYPSFISPELYYWTREEKNSNAEVDFVFQHKNRIFPVEVKAGRTGTLKSMQVYLCEKRLKHGIRFNMDLPNIGSFKTGITVSHKTTELSWTLLSLPLYMVSELKRIVDLKFI